MNMFILILIGVVALLLAIVAIIVVSKPKSKPVKKKTTVKKEKTIEFEDLMEIVKNPNTDSNTLLKTLMVFNENFKLDDKNSQKYLIFLSRVLTHKNVNKDIFKYFHKEVKLKNKDYKVELEAIERKALG